MKFRILQTFYSTLQHPTSLTPTPPPIHPSNPPGQQYPLHTTTPLNTLLSPIHSAPFLLPHPNPQQPTHPLHTNPLHPPQPHLPHSTQLHSVHSTHSTHSTPLLPTGPALYAVQPHRTTPQATPLNLHHPFYSTQSNLSSRGLFPPHFNPTSPHPKSPHRPTHSTPHRPLSHHPFPWSLFQTHSSPTSPHPKPLAPPTPPHPFQPTTSTQPVPLPTGLVPHTFQPDLNPPQHSLHYLNPPNPHPSPRGLFLTHSRPTSPHPNIRFTHSTSPIFLHSIH